MLDRARIIALKNNLRSDAGLAMALDLCASGGAAAMDRRAHGLEAGLPGDLVLVEGETVAHAVILAAPRALVVKGGRITARNGKSEMSVP